MDSTQKFLQGCSVVINKDTQLNIAAFSEPNTVGSKNSALSSCMSETRMEGLMHYDCMVGFKFRGISWKFLLRIVFYVLIVPWNYRAVQTTYCCTLDTYLTFRIFVAVDLRRLCHQENQECTWDYFSLITEIQCRVFVFMFTGNN